jgi:hypothetical protein
MIYHSDAVFKQDGDNVTTDAMKKYAQAHYNFTVDTQKPFGFEFRSTRSADVINVNTENSDFIMTDKFMQLDL